MKIYIAGSISDGGTLPIEVQAQRREVFYQAELALLERGHTPINPMRRGVDENKTWLDYMRDSLRDIAEADMIVLLPGWEGSRGARLEKQLGQDLGMHVCKIEAIVR